MQVSLLMVLGVAFPLALAVALPARAAELQVIAGGGIAVPLNEIATQFEQQSGHKLTIRYGTTPQLIEMARTAPFDLAVTPSEFFRDEATASRTASPTIDIARVGLGIAVRAGAPKPDVATPEALKQAILTAKTIGTIPASAAGAQVMKLFERLGVADAVKVKLKAAAGPAPLIESVKSGQSELGLFLINVLTTDGLDVLGPVPAGLDQVLVYTGAVAREPAQAEIARAFLAFLKSPSAKAVLRARGLVPT